MKVLGDWNWYLPSWLEWLPRVGAERDAAPPPDEPEEEPPAPDEPEAPDEPKPAPLPA
jgi:putative drug exporter of the RND superfamily